MDLRVMSFNLRYGTADDGPNSWPDRREAAFETIRRHAPDVLGLQEVLDFQLEELLAALPGYSAVGVGRDDGAKAGEFSPILYRAERLELERSGVFWFSSTPDMPGSRHPDCFHPRICTWAFFSHGVEGFGVYNVHLDNESANARVEASLQLIEALSDRRPSLVLGDYNAGEDDECVQIMRRSGFRDSYRVIHPHELDVQTYHGFGASAENEKIDYVWVDNNWAVAEAAIIRDRTRKQWPSDHYPVTAMVSALLTGR